MPLWHPPTIDDQGCTGVITFGFLTCHGRAAQSPHSEASTWSWLWTEDSHGPSAVDSFSERATRHSFKIFIKTDASGCRSMSMDYALQRRSNSFNQGFFKSPLNDNYLLQKQHPRKWVEHFDLRQRAWALEKLEKQQLDLDGARSYLNDLKWLDADAIVEQCWCHGWTQLKTVSNMFQKDSETAALPSDCAAEAAGRNILPQAELRDQLPAGNHGVLWGSFSTWKKCKGTQRNAKDGKSRNQGHNSLTPLLKRQSWLATPGARKGKAAQKAHQLQRDHWPQQAMYFYRYSNSGSA